MYVVHVMETTEKIKASFNVEAIKRKELTMKKEEIQNANTEKLTIYTNRPAAHSL